MFFLHQLDHRLAAAGDKDQTELKAEQLFIPQLAGKRTKCLQRPYLSLSLSPKWLQNLIKNEALNTRQCAWLQNGLFQMEHRRL